MWDQPRPGPTSSTSNRHGSRRSAVPALYLYADPGLRRKLAEAQRSQVAYRRRCGATAADPTLTSTPRARKVYDQRASSSSGSDYSSHEPLEPTPHQSHPRANRLEALRACAAPPESPIVTRLPRSSEIFARCNVDFQGSPLSCSKRSISFGVPRIVSCFEAVTSWFTVARATALVKTSPPSGTAARAERDREGRRRSALSSRRWPSSEHRECSCDRVGDLAQAPGT